jgi:hypothetical protein
MKIKTIYDRLKPGFKSSLPKKTLENTLVLKGLSILLCLKRHGMT